MKKQYYNIFGKIKNNNGITLGALVITIIVLLILAGVTISTLTGDNGLLQKASDAKIETINAEGLERIQLAVMASHDKNGIDTTLLAKNLSQINGLTDINNKAISETTEITLPIIIKLNNNQYMINENGEIIKDIIEYSKLRSGAYVNYPVYYNNVASVVNVSTKEEYYYPDNKYNGWRILNVNIESNEVKLISAGIPINYYVGNDANIDVENITTQFFNTPINEFTEHNFHKSGFKESKNSENPISEMYKIKSLFSNRFTKTDSDFPVVKDLSYEEVKEYFGPSNDYRSDDLFAIPSNNSYARNALATANTRWRLNIIDGWDGFGNQSIFGIRPVITLKSGVVFVESYNETNETITYNIYK